VLKIIKSNQGYIAMVAESGKNEWK